MVLDFEQEEPYAENETLVLKSGPGLFRDNSRPDLLGNDSTAPLGSELECLEEVRSILDLTRGETPASSRGADSCIQDEENVATQQLESAIADFYARLSVDPPESRNGVSLPGNSSCPEEHPNRNAPAEKASDAPLEPRQAPETADILSQFRTLARQTADQAIGQHVSNQLIARAKQYLWISSVAMLGTCGLLQIPWEQTRGLDLAISAAFVVAVGSTCNYCILSQRLRREFHNPPPKP